MKRSLWILFGVFCVLSSARWLIPSTTSDVLPLLEEQCLLYAAAGLGALLFVGKGLGARIAGLRWGRLAVAGVMLLGVPSVLVEFAGSRVPAVNRSAVFALLPAVVVLVTVSRPNAEEEERRFFAPALMAFGGVLLLLPVALPGSAREWVMLAIVCVAMGLVGVAGVWIYRLLQTFAVGDAIALACLANALFLLVWCSVTGSLVWQLSGFGGAISIASLLDLVTLALLIFLSREMPPVRFAARYLVISLLTVIEGYIVLRPELTVRMEVGLALLAAGAAWILFSKASGDEAVLSLR
jgi:drug/metabolite transporter (DMT)-like permease